MALNLRSRLSRIRKTQVSADSAPLILRRQETAPFLEASGWKQEISGLWSRTIERRMYNPLKDPDIPLGFFSKRLQGLQAQYRDLIFFDLETTGLSGGTGTVAFLAACGVFTDAGTLRITQFFMDDFPAEKAFVEAVNSVLSKYEVLVSYNGLCFDIPLFRTRCILNRFKFTADLPHVDLVYAARRVWKTALPERSLSRVEKDILGIERVDDIPGRFIPEIWLEFVKTGTGLAKLDKVFMHNADDIHSLAGLFVLFLESAMGKEIPLADAYGQAVMIARFDTAAAVIKLRKLYSNGDLRSVKLLLHLLKKNGNTSEYLELRAKIKKTRKDQESERSPS